MKRTTTHFAGYECLRLQNEALSLWVTRQIGPRIIGLALAGQANLLAELPEATLERPGGGRFHFRGGHRLWLAPEDPRLTYLPDDSPVTITETENGVRVLQPTEPQTGIQKSLTITLQAPRAEVLVEHGMHNRGDGPVELAPWAITQVRPGGTAILPQSAGLADEHGLWPNRHIVLWPYTRINSSHIQWGDRYVLIQARMTEGALKVGWPNPAGWLGYLVEGTLFIKQAAYEPSATYTDRGSSSQCYCDPRFLELETLGPLVSLAPGKAVSHRETWNLYPEVEHPLDETGVQRIVDQLGLTGGT